MMSRTSLIGTGTAVLIGTTLGFAPGAAAATPADAARSASSAPTSSVSSAARPAAPSSVPVTGTTADGDAFTGRLRDLTVRRVGDTLNLTGTVSGTGLPAGGTAFSAPIQSLDVPAGCSVLNLDLGPLDLDLLGLVVNLAPVSLDITAVPGPGKLLGNLLCAITGLLDRGGPLAGLTALLNRLLTGLGL